MGYENIVYYVLSGAAILLAVVATTYLLTVIMDRFFSFRMDSDRMYSTVSNKANLWGLRSEERRVVLEKIFSSKTRIFTLDTTATSTANNAIQDVEQERSLKEKETSAPSLLPDRRGEGEEKSQRFFSAQEDVNDMPAASQKEKKPNEVTLIAADLSEDNLQRTCAICLVPYENGDNVIAGVSCKHCLYHPDCIMRWMMKGHDNCPYCRTEMITAHEMRNAALEILGEERVNQVSLSSSTWWSQPATNATSGGQPAVAVSEIQMSEMGTATLAATRQAGENSPAIEIATTNDNDESRNREYQA